MNPVSAIKIPIITGSGAPSNGDGTDGQYWYDGTNGMVYGPKAAGVWPAGVRLQEALYIQSRLQNLITNGSGLLGSNENFLEFSFDPIEVHGGGGSFAKKTDGPWSAKPNEFIPVDTEKYYRMIFWAKSGNNGGTEYDPANRYNAGILQFDIDFNPLAPRYIMKFVGATDTTLAAALNPGDTTITLADATGWAASNATAYNRQMLWYGYTNSKGYTYPDYTYSRNSSYDISAYTTSGLWAVGGITGNVITLTSTWSGPAIPAGTAVRNGTSGASYKYCCFSNQLIPNSWTKYDGYIGTLENGTNTANKFNTGCAYIRLLFYQTAGTNNRIRFSDIWFSEMSTRNLESASATVPGVVDLANQTMGAGDKYFAGKVGINTTSPARRLDIIDNAAPQSRIGYSSTVYEERNVDANGDVTVFQRTGDETFHSGLSSTQERTIYSVKRTMPVATDASRTGLVEMSVNDYGGSRKAIAFGANGTESVLGFHGVTPIVRQNHIADAETAADDTELRAKLNDAVGKLNSVLALLESYGLTKTS